MDISKVLFFNILGWKLEKKIELIPDKCVFIVVPHTSWKDFIIGLCVRKILGLQINWVGKKELFVFPFSIIFKKLGGSPLNRFSTEGKVEAIAKLFENNDIYRLALSPEGTRKKVNHWRSGFYYIAQKANVPIVPIAIDGRNKKVQVLELFNLTDNIEEDFNYLYQLFNDVKGIVPENSFSKFKK